MNPATNGHKPAPVYVPPHSIDAETATLGAMVLEKPAIDAASALLTATDFYRTEHQHIFAAIVALNSQRIKVDHIALQAELARQGQLERVGGLPYLLALFDTMPSAANVGYWAQIVREKSILRSAMDVSNATINAAMADGANAEEVMATAAASLRQVETRRGTGGSEVLSSALLRVMEQAEINAEHGGQMTGLSTGFAELDRMTGGMQPSDLIILAARPSMGKTALALTIAERAALSQHKPVMMFSLEMPTDQLTMRLVCSRAEVQMHDFRRGRLSPSDWASVHETSREVYDAPLHICDDTMATPAFMARECRRLAERSGLSLIVIDYLQLVRCDTKIENRTQEVGAITKELKSLAREFRVPVIALSQLSRNVENRTDKRPLMADLRESGEIEAAADLVCFLYREGYYKRKDALGGMGQPDAGMGIEETEIIFAKHRNGPTGYVKLGFAPAYARFDNWQEGEF